MCSDPECLGWFTHTKEGFMPKKQVKPDSWAKLQHLIEEYAEAKIHDSWKGGGDPADYPIAEAQLMLARAKLDGHIEKMKREQE